ncbi:dTMP kinase, partial [Candidatus Falkowbacteria bacterium]|nr:dTMP kinase [Candidatus Falkowbacteria bacterium]
MAKGKFIVLEGIDGSGKATQTLLLSQKLENDGFKVKFINFPQYGQKSAGMIENYLRDQKYGNNGDTTPHQASLFFAMDRFDAKKQIEDWLKKGKTVLCDRYVVSNLAHQGCKIEDDEEREKFFQWVEDLEYNILKIPKPDINILLKIEPEKGQFLAKRDSKKKDLHEDDLNHLKAAAQIYTDLA